MATRLTAHEKLRRWIDASPLHNQSTIARELGVSRFAVSKWVQNRMTPSAENAEALERLTGGAIPSTLWPRRSMPKPKTRGAHLLQSVIRGEGGSVLGVAKAYGIPPRALARWAAGESAPRAAGVELLARVIDPEITAADFRVPA